MSINVANDATFEQTVLAVSHTKSVLVDFGAVWCGPCKMFDPIVEQVAHEYAANLELVKVDVDESLQVVQNYGIMSMPTVVLFKDGQPVKRVVGYMPKARLIAQLENLW